jgi:agarase
MDGIDDVVLASARHTDVLSFNHYSVELDRSFDHYYQLSGKPMLIGEFDFDSLDSGLLKAAVPVRNQHERGVGYSFYTEAAAAKPFMLGTHYFQYIDEPLTGREDGESSYNGFVNVADIPYSDLVDSARISNSRIYEIHNGSKEPSKLRPCLK